MLKVRCFKEDILDPDRETPPGPPSGRPNRSRERRDKSAVRDLAGPTEALENLAFPLILISPARNKTLMKR